MSARSAEVYALNEGRRGQNGGDGHGELHGGVEVQMLQESGVALSGSKINQGQLAHVAAFVFGGKDTDLNFIDLQWTIYQI